MTTDEHERYYAERSGLTVDAIRKQGGYSIVCDCDSMGCPGYSMVFAQRPEEWLEAIRRHVERGREQVAERNAEGGPAHPSIKWFYILVALAEGSKKARRASAS
jgi:hypothetical protein